MAKRKIKIDLRLSEDEAALLNSDVEKSGLSREAYLRAMIMQRPIKERPPMELVNALRYLQRIGNNMNQIATKANSLNFIDTAAYWENVDLVKNTIGKLLEVMYN